MKAYYFIIAPTALIECRTLNNAPGSTPRNAVYASRRVWHITSTPATTRVSAATQSSTGQYTESTSVPSASRKRPVPLSIGNSQSGLRPGGPLGDKHGDKEKKKYERAPGPTPVGRKKKKYGLEVAVKLPSATPTVKYRMRMLNSSMSRTTHSWTRNLSPIRKNANPMRSSPKKIASRRKITAALPGASVLWTRLLIVIMRFCLKLSVIVLCLRYFVCR